jgi:hypothetical protein
MRLRSDFWVSAYLRRCGGEGINVVLRRRGASEAGAIFVLIDHLNGLGDLYGPAIQCLLTEHSGSTMRMFQSLMSQVSFLEIETRLQKEIRFDADLWIVACESPDGQHWLDVVKE